LLTILLKSIGNTNTNTFCNIQAVAARWADTAQRAAAVASQPAGRWYRRPTAYGTSDRPEVTVAEV